MQPVPKLDRIDLKILTQLQRNGRLTNVDLASRVGLSASPCLIRVKRLEAAGYITGYGAQIDVRKITSVLTVFTEITLSDHRRDDFSRFEAQVRKLDTVVECHLISGGYDYLVKFITRDVEHYQTIMENLLDLNIGIEKYFSYIVIKSPIVKQSFLIGDILPENGT
ncbi:Lrp/AsnC family transcriptional regulator [Acetobacter oeni]|uniref:AsnC family transcriptional regulator n=1 Tax=Acetobacter oeni TaxID=304077 RepID=A0A511XNQ8_9PROT|nr:winged helix-turn-helix transcriptional regulator [Acetobacter oeni]MBB3884409.1 DNA-binding Lrp family transcriptional regulator [Acetobacter oeni]NHO20369.1 winged helix-turn-helix transcriptional regulator [Acetobacter oeni]GBR09870.1 transcriptional regulator [Acetobacter oeni LMG 21952]GEN64590.1 AsnC family transcriptional regulator [Acetobacter oeni]